MPPRRMFALLAVVLPALILAGCGPRADETSTGADGAPKPTADVTATQIEQLERGSAERTSLEWWRDLQLNAPEHARLLYLEPPPLPDLAGQFNYVAGRFDGPVKIVSSSEEDGVTAVTVRLKPPSGKPRQETLQLELDGNAWRLDEPRFIDLEVARLQQAEQRE